MLLNRFVLSMFAKLLSYEMSYLHKKKIQNNWRQSDKWTPAVQLDELLNNCKKSFGKNVRLKKKIVFEKMVNQ